MPLRTAQVLRLIAFVVLAACVVGPAVGGGSGYNTIIVINKASSNSCELGNYYREARSIPPENVLHINWTGGNVSWSSNDFYMHLAGPLVAMVSSRGLTNQAWFVALSSDVPYRTLQGVSGNGTTSALFYGPKDGSSLTSSYYLSEAPVEMFRPSNAPGYSFLTTLLAADSLESAKAMIDRSVMADGSFPTEPIILAKTSDPMRNIRHSAFNNTILDELLLGRSRIFRTNTDTPWPGEKLAGLQMGLPNFVLPPDTFRPGAIADNLTSFGGYIFDENGQTTLLEFIKAGASGSYGTVMEPGADASKFPNPQVFFYQSRGFSLAEAYYQSIHSPHMGLIVGEPLCAPFRRLLSAHWVTTNSMISGLQIFSAEFSGPDDCPPQKVDLFVDGKYLRTVTNIAPSAGNQIEVAMNGFPLTYTVPQGASVETVAAGLASAINSVSNITRISANRFGDRVELRSFATNQQSKAWFFVNSGDSNPAPVYYRATYLPDPITPLIGMSKIPVSGSPVVVVRSPGAMPYMLEATTNLLSWQPIYTNLSGTDVVFSDPAAAYLSKRFYRVAGDYTAPEPPLLGVSQAAPQVVKISVSASNSPAYVLEASSNLVTWIAQSTNAAGQSISLMDYAATNSSPRFYRTAPMPIPQPVLANFAVGEETNLIKVDNSVRPYKLEYSTNLQNWAALSTNLLISDISLSARATQGTAQSITTHASVARGTFVSVTNRGMRQFSIRGNPQVSSYINATFTKTNGVVVSIGVTNSSGGTLLQLVQSLAASVNNNPELLTPNGAEVVDTFTNAAGSVYISFYARSPGVEASALRIWIAGGTGLTVLPPGPNALDSNLSDLLPRNHVYVCGGAHNLPLQIPLDTTALPDGYHEIAAVATEGSHVRTQTRITQSVLVTNTPLFAQLSVPISTNVPVSEAAQILVWSNTNAVQSMRLYSTAGMVAEAGGGVATNTFNVYGTNLGVGLHPFLRLGRDDERMEIPNQDAAHTIHKVDAA